MCPDSSDKFQEVKETQKKKKGKRQQKAVSAPEVIAQLEEEADIQFVMKEIASLFE